MSETYLFRQPHGLTSGGYLNRNRKADSHGCLPLAIKRDNLMPIKPPALALVRPKTRVLAR